MSNQIPKVPVPRVIHWSDVPVFFHSLLPLVMSAWVFVSWQSSSKTDYKEKWGENVDNRQKNQQLVRILILLENTEYGYWYYISAINVIKE